MKVPFLNLATALSAEKALVERAISRVLQRGQLVLGPEVLAFERAFADYHQARHCVSVGNGLDALSMMLEAVGVRAGDEVIVPSNTFIATWFAVTSVGARVVPVEPDPEAFNLDAGRVEAAFTNRTKAVLAVHLYGQCAEMRTLQQICKSHRVHLLADAAQAAGARHHGHSCARFGSASAFSFYPTKNLGALGDGGAVLTDSDEIASRLRLLRNYGCPEKDQHEIKGRNSRLDEIQAAILTERLAQYPQQQVRRRHVAQRYLDGLAGLPDIRLPVGRVDEHAWHLFTVRVDNGRRDALRSLLSARGIGTGVYYPIPPHKQPAYRDEATAFPPLPIAEALAEDVLSLPLNGYLTDEEVDDVIEAVRSSVNTWGN